MLLSDIAEEYGLTKLAALDACALGGLRVRSFHTELTDSQVKRLRWVLGPAASPTGGSPGGDPASLLSRWDGATTATSVSTLSLHGSASSAAETPEISHTATTTTLAPPPPPTTPPPPAPAAHDDEATARDDRFTTDRANPATNEVEEPGPPAEPDEFDDETSLDPAHLAALALVEAEEETIDAAALAAELRRLAAEEDEPEPAISTERPEDPPPASPSPEGSSAEGSSVQNPEPDNPVPSVGPAVEPESEPDQSPLGPVAVPTAGAADQHPSETPTTRELSRHPFKPLTFDDVVADLGAQLQAEHNHQIAREPDSFDVPSGNLRPVSNLTPLVEASGPPTAASPSPQPRLDETIGRAPTPAAPSSEPQGRSAVAPPTGGTRLRDLDAGGDAAGTGALAFLDHRNVIEATSIPEQRPVEKRLVGSLVMAVWIAVLIGAVAFIVQLRGSGDDAAATDSAGTSDAPIGAVLDVFDLSEGDCFTTPGIGSVQTAVVVPCNEPHTAEVYATAEYPTEDGLFPGDETLRSFGDQACLDAFRGFVGVDYLVSGLDYYFVTPQDTAWNDGGRRTVSCSVIEPGFRPVVGTLRDAAR